MLAIAMALALYIVQCNATQATLIYHSQTCSLESHTQGVEWEFCNDITEQFDSTECIQCCEDTEDCTGAEIYESGVYNYCALWFNDVCQEDDMHYDSCMAGDVTTVRIVDAMSLFDEVTGMTCGYSITAAGVDWTTVFNVSKGECALECIDMYINEPSNRCTSFEYIDDACYMSFRDSCDLELSTTSSVYIATDVFELEEDMWMNFYAIFIALISIMICICCALCVVRYRAHNRQLRRETLQKTQHVCLPQQNEHVNGTLATTYITDTDAMSYKNELNMRSSLYFV